MNANATTSSSKEVYFVCATCGKEYPAQTTGGNTGGYGIDANNRKHCLPCCAEREKAHILENGKGTLYLVYEQEPRSASYCGWFTPKNGKLTDWGGFLSIPINRIKRGGHNIAGCRYDVWFTFGGREWHGVTYGDNTQICHIRAIKSKA